MIDWSQRSDLVFYIAICLVLAILTGCLSGESVDPDNPWNEKELTVDIQTDGYVERQAEESFKYWERNSGEYAGYNISFSFAEEDADIVVVETESTGICGFSYDLSGFPGCAPLVNDTPPERPVKIEIEGGYSEGTMDGLIKHEVGHVLGVEHGEEPKEIMSPSIRVKPYFVDLPERQAIWVSMDYSSVDYPEGRKIQLKSSMQSAFSKLDRNFEIGDNSRNTHLEIKFSDSGVFCSATTLQTGRSSCATIEDVDDDGKKEYSIRFNRISEPEIVKKHAGYWTEAILKDSNETEVFPKP